MFGRGSHAAFVIDVCIRLAYKRLAFFLVSSCIVNWSSGEAGKECVVASSDSGLGEGSSSPLLMCTQTFRHVPAPASQVRGSYTPFVVTGLSHFVECVWNWLLPAPGPDYYRYIPCCGFL